MRSKPVASLLLVLAAAIAAAAEAPSATAPTAVILVRHAEKVTGGGADPALTAAGEKRARTLAHVLGGLDVRAVYSTPYARTLGTAAPLASAAGLEVIETPLETTVEAYAADLAAKIRGEHAGEVVVVVGHSNTTPAVLRALGVAVDAVLADSDYDNLFVVVLAGEGAPHFLPLRYGRETPP